MNIFESAWFYWSVGIGVGLPVGLIALTEWHHALVRRRSYLAGPVSLLRNYLLPLGALLLLLVKVTEIPTGQTSVRVITTLFAFMVLVLLLSGFNATLFQAAPEASWRKRLPAILIDVARLLLIGFGLAVIFSRIWGIRIGGLFAALGVTSVVIGLMLQNSVGQIVSGLFLLFEQPFRIGDWLETPTARGRVVEVNWRAVHIETGSGLQIMPNSVLAGTSFTNLSRPLGAHRLVITATFSSADPPDRVCALLARVAAALPQSTPDAVSAPVSVGEAEYRITIGLASPGEDGSAQATFMRWLWYAARREGLHLDGADDDFATTDRVQHALRTVVAPALRLREDDQQSLLPHAKLVRYGTGETVQHADHVSAGVTFLIAGSVRLTAPTDDGSAIPVGVLHEGSYLGLTSLTRQPNVAGAYALDEVTALEIDREHVEQVVVRNPSLLQELGRVIDEQRRTVEQAGVPERLG